MKKQKLIIIIFILSLFLPLSHTYAGIILDTHKYAWSNNIGYINFENVLVEDNLLSGYAWSANKGFIKFDPVFGGVLNDGEGDLSGYAWGDHLGWINFGNVSIDGTNGKFSGTATGSLVGIITFDCPDFCDVETDWRGAIAPTPPPATPGSSSGSRLFFLSPDNTNIVFTQPSFPENIIPEDFSSAVILSDSDNAILSQEGALIANQNAGSLLVGESSEDNPPLFDVISEPALSQTQKSSIPFIISLIVMELLLLLLIFLIVKKIRTYIIRRRISKAKENINFENNENKNENYNEK